MAERHLKKCSKYLAIKETQMKATLRFCLSPVKMVNIKNTDESFFYGKDMGLGEFSCIAGGSANLYSCFGNQYGSFSEN